MKTEYGVTPHFYSIFVHLCDKYFPRDSVKTVFDVGSCHALEAIEAAKAFPNANVYSFEANPNTIPVIEKNIRGRERNHLVPKAVTLHDGVVDFYPIDKANTRTHFWDGNQGASSLLIANGEYDRETYAQYRVEVPCTRLDTVCNENNISPDVIWMDLQGTELDALISLGDHLDNVKLIHTELEVHAMYEDQCLLQDVEPWLEERGFVMLWGNRDALYGTDFIFLRKDLCQTQK